MAITRSKASQLLNQKEMALYDESRINGLRRLDGKALATRVTRARAARDRARDLVQRQKLASRSKTGSKRGSGGADNQRSKDKAGLMADILGRFEKRLREVQREEARAAKATKSAATRTTAKTRTTTKKTAAKAGKTASGASGSAARRAAGGDTAAKKASRKSASGTAARPKGKPADGGSQSRQRRSAATDSGATPPARKGAAAKAEAGGKRTRKRSITPEEALAQTQALLEAKQARDSEPKPWTDAASAVDPGSPGYQSDSAARRAKRLHAAEIRLPANQGSVSTHDRINQGKRDYRGRADD